MSSTTKPTRVLSVFALVMITVTSVDSIRNLPATALMGSELVFYFFLAALTFLIPAALVSAELSTHFPKQGGVYVWVKEALGESWGFLAIWFQWVENLFWYPAILSFIAGTLGYLIDPSLAHSKVFIVSVILSVFWGMTLLNFFGMKLSARFSIFCGIVGLFIPMALIIGLGIVWMCQGHLAHIGFSFHDFWPHPQHTPMLVAYMGIVLSFCGIEITTVYAQEVKNPQQDYPKALWISTLILLSTLILGSLSIAVVIPANHLSLLSGLMQAFDAFFATYHLTALTPLLGIMMIIGGLGGLSNWIIAPCKGLWVAASEGNLPKRLTRTNARGAPVSILWMQAVITSIITLVFLLLPEINSAYWLLTSLAAQLYMLMYILMFVSGWVLRRRMQSTESHGFRIPKRFGGMAGVASIGLLGATATLFIGFVPPAQATGYAGRYEFLLSTGLLSLMFLPWILRRLAKRQFSS